MSRLCTQKRSFIMAHKQRTWHFNPSCRREDYRINATWMFHGNVQRACTYSKIYVNHGSPEVRVSEVWQSQPTAVVLCLSRSHRRSAEISMDSQLARPVFSVTLWSHGHKFPRTSRDLADYLEIRRQGGNFRWDKLAPNSSEECG